MSGETITMPIEEWRATLARIARLEAEIVDLQAQLVAATKNPRNSSLPPSSEHPHAKPPPAKPKSKRRRGGQRGHKKHQRALIPPEQCVAVHEHHPEQCRGCGEALSGDDPAPLRHQVWDVPEIKPLVTEHRRHRLTCAGCGQTTCAKLPPGVPEGQAGPRLLALTALLMGVFRQSKRRVALFLEQVLHQPCSPGWVVKLQNTATAALRPIYDELATRLNDQPALAIDETPNKQADTKAWLWTFVATTFTVFVFRTTRSASVLTEMLGHSFGGVIHCDRAKMYYCQARLQWCWAHLIRDWQALIDSGDGVKKRLGHDLLRPTKRMFALWNRFRAGTLTRIGFQRLMAPIREEIEALLLRGQFAGIGTAREIYARRESLWRFVDVEGVEPTNNASERALRHGVIWRKLSFGTQSASGSRFVETILTIVETCRQQSRNVVDFVTQAIETHLTANGV
jgi:transposase